MKLPKLQKWAKLEITWRDASVDSGANNAERFIRDYRHCTRRTLGYYLGNKLDTIFIAETDDRDADVWDVTPQDCERLNALPLGMITEIKVLV